MKKSVIRRKLQRFFKRFNKNIELNKGKKQEEIHRKKIIKKTRKRIGLCQKLITLNEKFPNAERLSQIKQRICFIEKQIKEQEEKENVNKQKNMKKLFKIRQLWDEYVVEFPLEFNEEETNFQLPIDISLGWRGNNLSSNWNIYNL